MNESFNKVTRYKSKYELFEYINLKHKIIIKKIPIYTKSKYDNYIQKLQLLKKINHYSLIKIYDWSYIYNNLYISMEYTDGLPLYYYIKNNYKFTLKQMLNIIYQLLSCIDRLHTFNICYGEINIHNIIVTNPKHFDIILLNHDNTQLYIGHLLFQNNNFIEYISPEVIKCRYTCKSDIWSIGCILYILITKRFPFIGKTKKELFTNITKKKYSQPLDKLDINKNVINLINILFEYKYIHRISAKDACNLEIFTYYL